MRKMKGTQLVSNTVTFARTLVGLMNELQRQIKELEQIMEQLGRVAEAFVQVAEQGASEPRKAPAPKAPPAKPAPAPAKEKEKEPDIFEVLGISEEETSPDVELPGLSVEEMEL